MSQPTYSHTDRSAVMYGIVQAFRELQAGSSDLHLFDILTQTMNLGIVRAEKVGRAEVEVFLAARDALLKVEETYPALKVFTFDFATFNAIARGIQGYDDLLAKSTPQQMEAAMAECHRRLNSGHHATRQTVH